MIDRMNRYEDHVPQPVLTRGLVATQIERLAMLEKQLAEAVGDVACRFAPVIVQSGPQDTEAAVQLPSGSEMGQHLYRIANGIERYIGDLHAIRQSADV